MPPKRKANIDSDEEEFASEKITKRVKAAAEESDESVEVPKPKGKAKVIANGPKSWQEIELEGDDEGSVPIYDDCNEIRRKIRLLQKTPGWKVTHWLRDIGGVNSNSYGRFMAEKGPTGGAGNSLYYAAYVYFEKVRIMEGKKKTQKRISNETNGMGFSRDGRKGMWVYVGR